MRRIPAIAALAAFALAPSAHCAPSKIATQEWVRRIVSESAGSVAPVARVETNVVSSAGGAAVTNRTYSSSFRFAGATNCVAISLTFSSAPPSASAPFARARAAAQAASAGGEPITFTIQSGFYVDAKGREIMFDFGGGFEFSSPYTMPEEVSEEHVCSLGADCVCVEWGANPDLVEIPPEYKPVTLDDIVEKGENPANWIDPDEWPGRITTAPSGKRVFWVVAEDGSPFNMANIMKSDAWLAALLDVVVPYNDFVEECEANYRRAHVCDRDSGEPQHDWDERSCGSSSWATCLNNPAHTRGTESHAYAGGQGDAASHPCVCGATSQPHQWGSWVCDGYSGEYATLVRICPVTGCGASALAKVPLSAIKECVAEIGLHVPKGDGCGCKCGKGENLDSGAFHFWDGSDIVRGVTNCLCVCGAKHVFREPTTYWKNQHQDEWCEGVCQSCRRRLKDGRPAAESDHTPKPRSARKCGCRCGWFGVDQEHTDGGREAKTQRMHPQCMVNNTGDPSSPPYCKCFGTGNGGRWHYHEPFPDSSCPAVCQYMATEDSSLGHLAAGEPSPTSGGTRPATAAHHRGKSYGCGCRCGRCGENNRPDWKGNDALHHPAQNAADQCHCSCESRRLVGSGKGGHEFSGTSCTCTCGGAHRSSLNACGLCLGGDGSTPCGKIHRNGELLEDTADNHRFDSDSCTCRCGSQTRDHDWGAEWRGDPTTTYCPRCGATLDRYPMWRTCKRCGLQEDTGRFEYSGAHRDGCTETGGNETTPPAVDECGECGHIAPGHYPSCSQYASGDQGETDDTGSIGEI